MHLLKCRRMLVILALASVPGTMLNCSGSSDRALAETERQGSLIITGLERYRVDNGRYPDSLKQLVPQYLEDIPTPAWGLRRWHYDRSLKPTQEVQRMYGARNRDWGTDTVIEYFELANPANAEAHPNLYFNSVRGHWVLDH